MQMAAGVTPMLPVEGGTSQIARTDRTGHPRPGVGHPPARRKPAKLRLPTRIDPAHSVTAGFSPTRHNLRFGLPGI